MAEVPIGGLSPQQLFDLLSDMINNKLATKTLQEKIAYHNVAQELFMRASKNTNGAICENKPSGD